MNSPSRFPEFSFVAQHVASHNASISWAKVLDVSSPKLVGFYLAANYQADFQLTDISYANLAEYKLLWDLIKERARGSATFAVEDARALTYPEETFDVVYSVSVVEHVEGEDGDSMSVGELIRYSNREVCYC